MTAALTPPAAATPSHLPRGAAVLLAEGAGELGLVVEAPAERQFADRQVAVRVAQLAVHGRQALSSSYLPIEAQSGEIGTLGRYLAARTQQHGLITRAMGDAIARCPLQIRR